MKTNILTLILCLFLFGLSNAQVNTWEQEYPGLSHTAIWDLWELPDGGFLGGAPFDEQLFIFSETGELLDSLTPPSTIPEFSNEYFGNIPYKIHMDEGNEMVFARFLERDDTANDNRVQLLKYDNDRQLVLEKLVEFPDTSTFHLKNIVDLYAADDGGYYLLLLTVAQKGVNWPVDPLAGESECTG